MTCVYNTHAHTHNETPEKANGKKQMERFFGTLSLISGHLECFWPHYGCRGTRIRTSRLFMWSPSILLRLISLSTIWQFPVYELCMFLLGVKKIICFINNVNKHFCYNLFISTYITYIYIYT